MTREKCEQCAISLACMAHATWRVSFSFCKGCGLPVAVLGGEEPGEAVVLPVDAITAHTCPYGHYAGQDVEQCHRCEIEADNG